MVYGSYAPYFVDVCRNVMDDVLHDNIFLFYKSTATKIIYLKENTFFAISYEPMDSPDYALMIDIGYVKTGMRRVLYNDAGWYHMGAISGTQ